MISCPMNSGDNGGGIAGWDRLEAPCCVSDEDDFDS